jgi:hypothetical protein
MGDKTLRGAKMVGLMQPKLYMWKDKNFRELFEEPTGKRIELPVFGLTNSLLNTFKEGYSADPDEIMGKLREWITCLLTKTGETGFKNDTPENDWFKALITLQQFQAGDMERPVELFATMPLLPNKEAAYLYEIQFLQYALFDWLQPSGEGRAGRPHRKTPSQKYTESFNPYAGWGLQTLNMEHFLLEVSDSVNIDDLPIQAQMRIRREVALLERNMQFCTLTQSLNTDKKIKAKSETCRAVEERRVTSECFVSNQGFLPLVWAEVLYAVRNDIFAQICQVCKDWFPIIPGKYTQKYCPGCPSEAKRLAQQQRRKTPASKRTAGNIV